MSYGIPFDFDMPQFVNTRASQRVVVSLHAGGLGAFGGEGAQRSSLSSERAWHGVSQLRRSSRHVRRRLPRSTVSGGAACALQVQADPRPPGRAPAGSAWGVPVRPLASLGLETLSMGQLPGPVRRARAVLVCWVRGSSTPRCVPRDGCRNQGGAKAWH